MNMNRKKLRYGGFSLLITVLFLTGVVLLNVLAGMLTGRFYFKADLTATDLYTLSGEAADYLRGLEETVDVIVLSEESAWLADSLGLRIIEILQNYASMGSGRLRVQYVNPDLNSFDGPAYSNSLAELKTSHTALENMQRNDIIFLSGRRAARVAMTSLYTWSYDDYGRQMVTGIKADQELIRSLVYVLNEKIPGAVFLEGHNEDATEFLKIIFENSGYACSSVNLSLQDVPDDTAVIVSAAPKLDFLGEEVVKLEEYLSAGGNAMIFYDFSTLSLPLLDAFLAQWGVSFETKLVRDDIYNIIPPASLGFPVVGLRAPVKAGSLPSLADVTETQVAINFARSIRPEWPADPDGVFANGRFTGYPLIVTNAASSYAKDYSRDDLTTLEKESGDETGSFALAYDIRQIGYDDGGNQIRSHLIVSTIGLVDDAFLMYYGQFNLPLYHGLANDFNPFGKSSPAISSKQLMGQMMQVSAGQTRAVLVLMVIAMPLMIVLLGILVWRKRRHK